MVLVMILLMISGIAMSRYVFTFLPEFASASLARRLHLPCSYWAFVLMSIHMGMHWNMMLGMIKRKFPVLEKSGKPIGAVLAAVLVISGSYMFIKHHIAEYLFLRTEFALYMYMPIPVHIFEYLLIMGGIISITYYFMKLIRK